MNFLTEYIHQPFPDLAVSNVNGMRFYEAPNGLKYPSITTVLVNNQANKKVYKNGVSVWELSKLVLFRVRQLVEVLRFIGCVKII